jgi:hypothetical protein
MTTNYRVLDKGPREPVAPDNPDDEEATAAYKAAVRDYEAWHKRHPDEPPVHVWPAVDARHAVAADPERYEIQPDPPGRPTFLPPPSMAERISSVEARLARLEAEVFPEEQPEPEPEPTDLDTRPDARPEPEPDDRSLAEAEMAVPGAHNRPPKRK